MPTLNALNFDDLPTVEDCLADPRLIEVRHDIACAETLLAAGWAAGWYAETLLAAGSYEQRRLRMDEYRLKRQQEEKFYYRPRRFEGHLERFRRKVSQRPWHWLLGKKRQQAITQRHQEFKSKRSQIRQKETEAFNADYQAEVLIDQAVTTISSVVRDVVADIHHNLVSQSSGREYWVSGFTSREMVRRELSNILWQRLGLARYQEHGELTNPEHVEECNIKREDGTWHSETRIKTKPEYGKLLYYITAETWPRIKSVVSHVLGDDRLAVMEESLRQSVEAHIESGKEWWSAGSNTSYQMRLIFLGPESAFDYMRSVLQENVLFLRSPDRLLEDMRHTHRADPHYAVAVEDPLTRAIVAARAQPIADLHQVMVERYWGQDTNRHQTSELCLNLLKDIAPEKAQALAAYNPVETIFSLAQKIMCARAAALRAMPDDDKERALRLLHHFKFAAEPVGGHVVAAIAAISFATPLQPERITELNDMAERFLGRIDKGALFHLAARWHTMSLAEKMVPILEWHEQASDVFVLASKNIELVDAGQLDEKNDFSETHAMYNHHGPIQLAVGATVPVTRIIAALVHETLHQRHLLIAEGLALPSSAFDGALFKAQNQTQILDPRPTPGMDSEQERRARKLAHIIYRTRISERESHYIGNYVRERLDLLRLYAEQNPAAIYLIEDSTKTNVPLGKLLVLIKGRDVQVEKAKLEMLSTERPVFDIVVENGSVRVNSFAAFPVQSHLFTADHLQALHELGVERVTVRFPKSQTKELDALLNATRSYPLPPIPTPPAIPSFEEVFGFPARGQSGTPSALALPAPALGLNF